MDVVFGDGPLARALVTWLAADGPAVWAVSGPREGSFLWRDADVATGRGVGQALRGATRVFHVHEDGAPCDGLYLVLRRAQGLKGATAVPLGVRSPRGLDEVRSQSRVHLGAVWGPEEPLVAAWARAIAAGRRVWVADPGRVRPVTAEVAVRALSAAADRGGVHWTIAGERSVRLPALAEAIAAALEREPRVRSVPLSWACWRAGVDVASVQAWVDMPEAPSVCDGWRPEASGTWWGDPARWTDGR